MKPDPAIRPRSTLLDVPTNDKDIAIVAYVTCSIVYGACQCEDAKKEPCGSMRDCAIGALMMAMHRLRRPA